MLIKNVIFFSFRITMVLLSNYDLDKNIIVENEIKKLDDQMAFKPTTLPKDEDEKPIKNPFLDISVRELVDEFVLTWNKILIELMDMKKYDVLKTGEWWDKLYALFFILKEVFWVDDRLFHIGVGFVVMSFFVFFVCVTYK